MIAFRTAALRDDLARRLGDLAVTMIRSRDQGLDGRISVSDTMIGDIRTAAYVVGMAGLLPHDDEQSPHEASHEG